MNYSSIKQAIYKEWFLLLVICVGISMLWSGYSYYLLILLLPTILIKSHNNFKVDKLLVYILGFSVSYIFFLYLNNLTVGPAYTIYCLFYPSIFYLIGKYLGNKYDKNIILLFLLIIFVSFEFITLKNILTSFFTGEIIRLDRSIEDITGFELSATLYGVIVSVGLAGIPMILVKTNNKIESRLKILFFVLGILSLLSVIHLVNRTGIVILLADFILILFLLMKEKKISFSTFIVLIILIVGVNYWLSNNSIIRDAYLLREEGSSWETGGDRISRWVEGISCIYKQPWGGGVYEGSFRHYAHNLWLDVLEMGGIVPFVFLVIGTIKAIKLNIVCVSEGQNKSIFFSNYMALLGLTFFLQCFVEPIMEATIIYFCLYTLFWGIISASITKNRKLMIPM